MREREWGREGEDKKEEETGKEWGRERDEQRELERERK